MFLLEKKHDKACIYCYILLQSFPRMNYFNTTILLICSYICHHKQLKQGNLRLKNTDKELCFLQRHVPGYLTNWKRTQKLIFQCFPCIYVKRKLQHQQSYYLSCTTQINPVSVFCNTKDENNTVLTVVVLTPERNVHHFPVWILVLQKIITTFYMLIKKKFFELNGKINKYE